MRQAGWRVSGGAGSGELWTGPECGPGWATTQRAGVVDGGGHGAPLKRDWGQNWPLRGQS